MELIVINQKKNKTLNFIVNWSILVLFILFVVSILILFIYGVVNFARNRGDYKKLHILTQENMLVQKEIELRETEVKALKIILDSLTQSDTILKDFSSLKPLKQILLQSNEQHAEKDSTDAIEIDKLPAIIDELLLKATSHYSLTRAITSHLEQNQSLKDCVPSIAPLNGWFMRGFGYCLDPFTGSAKMHEGIDIAAPAGTPIIASADGIVKKVENTKDFGTTIEIVHERNFTTIYAHCQNPRVHVGQSVKRGDIIAGVGISGKTSGPHLHYEIRVAGVPVDPLNYIILNKTANK